MVVKDTTYFAKSALGGGIAAMFSHAIVVPLDVIKTRMQLSPTQYKSLAQTTTKIASEEGMGALLLGLGPTFYGYTIQGLFKYGCYEIFKDRFAKMLGEEKAMTFRTPMYLLSGVCAEVIADISLAPAEAVRIRIVSQPKYASGFFGGLSKMFAQEGLSGLYRGLIPLMLKQVPYTAVKFAVFEASLEVIYAAHPKPREQMTRRDELGISFAAGVVGGVASAIASHPADTILSKVNAVKYEGSMLSAIGQATRDLGAKGLWAGLATRCGMVGALAALQLFTYDAAKVALGLPVSIGIGVKPKAAPVATLPEIKH